MQQVNHIVDDFEYFHMHGFSLANIENLTGKHGLFCQQCYGKAQYRFEMKHGKDTSWIHCCLTCLTEANEEMDRRRTEAGPGGPADPVE